MKPTEAFSELLEEEHRVAQNPNLWCDNAWVANYYFLRDTVYNALIELEKAKPIAENMLDFWTDRRSGAPDACDK